jgi:prepilin-type processing-associated H-X9-DG protein
MELLTVIVIILILAAILFPIFARARERARTVKCQENLRQIHKGLMDYVNDFDDYFPVTQVCPFNSGVAHEVTAAPNTAIYSGLPAWAYVLYPRYTAGSKKILKCPSDRNDDPNTCSYVYNNRLGGAFTNSNVPGAAYNNDETTRLKFVPRSAGPTGRHGFVNVVGGTTQVETCIAFADYATWSMPVVSPGYIAAAEALPLFYPHFVPGPVTGATVVEAPYNDPTLSHSRHRGMANYVFLDGHARAYISSEIKSSSTGGLGADWVNPPGGGTPDTAPDNLEDTPGPDPTGTHPSWSPFF